MALPEYRSARDLFEAAASAAAELERRDAMLERMRVAEGPRAQSYAPRVSGTGADPTGTGQTDARLDYERLTAPRAAEDRALLDLAAGVCYGRDGAGGVAALMGGEYAEVLYLRYVRRMKWRAVAAHMGLCQKTCENRARAALDLVDAYGIAGAVAGVGAAS